MKIISSTYKQTSIPQPCKIFYFDFSVSPMSRYWIPKPPVRDEDSK